MNMLISTQKCLFLKCGKHEGMLTLYICIAPKNIVPLYTMALNRLLLYK